MKIDVVEYFIGDDRSPLELWWEISGELLDLSTAHSYEGKLVSLATGTTVFTTTTGFSGATGSGTKSSGTPNLVKTWPTSGELNIVTSAGRYLFQIVATRASGNEEETLHVILDMKARY